MDLNATSGMQTAQAVQCEPSPSGLRAVIGETRLLDRLPIAVYVCAAGTGEIQYFNEHAALLLGRRPERGETDEGFFVTPMAGAFNAGTTVRDEEAVIRHPNGSTVIVSVDVEPLFDDSGAHAASIYMLRDITVQKIADEAQFRLAAIVESCEDAVVSKDLNGIITSWNAGAERMFGYTASEAIGKPVAMLAPPECRNEMPKILNQVRRGEPVQHYETRRQRKDGRIIDVSLTVSPVRDRRGRIIGASKIARDITFRKAEEAERTMLLAKEQEARKTAELLNSVGLALAAELNPEKLAQFVTDIARTLLGAEVSSFTRDTYIFAGYRRVIRSDDISQDSLRQGYAPHSVMSANSRIRSYLAAPVVARSGEILGGLIFGHSQPGAFTEQHEKLVMGITAQAAIALDNARLLEQAHFAQGELERSNEDLRRANQDLETFAYSASHDLKEPLRTIALSAQVLERLAGESLTDEGSRFLASIVHGAQRMEHLLQDLLAYTTVAKSMESPPPSIDSEEVLRSVLEGLSGTIAQTGAEVTSGSLPAVAIHEARLELLFQNLIGNALKYRSARPPQIHVSATSGDGWQVFSVSDNGIGIEPEYADQVFGLFKRLHSGEEFPGSGIGLAICKRIVEHYGGRIWLEKSAPGAGSTFCFAVPANGRNGRP